MTSSASVSAWLSEAVGSSMKTSVASPTSARAIATICRWAMGRAAQRRVEIEPNAEPLEDAAGCRPSWRRSSTRRGRAPRLLSKAMFSATDISGNSARSCQITWMPSCARHRRAQAFDRAALEEHGRALLGLMDAADDLDQRALAAAVLAGQAQHFAPPDVEADVVERFDAAELLGDVFEMQERCVGRGVLSGRGLSDARSWRSAGTRGEGASSRAAGRPYTSLLSRGWLRDPSWRDRRRCPC